MKKIISILLIFISIWGFSNELDSLKKIIPNSKGVELISNYNKIAHIYYYTNRDSAYKYSYKALSLLKKFPDKKEKLEVYNNLGMIASNTGLFKEGFNYLFDALKIAEELKDTFQISRINNNIGVSYMQIKEYKDAESFLKKAVQYKDNQKVKIGPVYNNLGLIKEIQGLYNDAYKYYSLAEENYKKEHDTTGIAGTIGNLGGVKLQIGKTEEGFKDLMTSYNMVVKLKDKYRQAIILNKISLDYYFTIKDYKNALKYIKKSTKMSLDNNYPELTYENYYGQSVIYSAMGDYKTALNLREKEIVIQDSIFSNDIKTIVQDINIRYDNLKKEKTIELLNKQTEINEAKAKTQRVWIFILIFIAIIFSIIGILIYKYNIKQDVINEQIVSKNIEIVKQEKELEITEEKYTYSHLETDKELQIANKIKDILKNEKLYTDSNLTINSLADKIEINRTYVSQVINNYFKVNFNTLINKYRIKEARKLLLENTNLSIEGISIEVGFRSKSVFNGSFKLHTGVTPSVFIANSKAQKKSIIFCKKNN